MTRGRQAADRPQFRSSQQKLRHINDDFRAGNMIGLVRGEKQRLIRNLLRLPGLMLKRLAFLRISDRDFDLVHLGRFCEYFQDQAGSFISRYYNISSTESHFLPSIWKPIQVMLFYIYYVYRSFLENGECFMIKMNPYMKRRIKGMKFIGAGGTRVVYDLGNGYVFKIAKSKKGILCNKMEVTMYKSSLKPLKKYLAPIIDHDTAYRWLIMKKYDQKYPANSAIYRRKLKNIVNMLLDNGIIPSSGVRHYVKPYTPNLRLKRNSQIVVIDYGGFKYGLG